MKAQDWMPPLTYWEGERNVQRNDRLLCKDRRVHACLCDCVGMRIVTGSGRSCSNPTLM